MSVFTSYLLGICSLIFTGSSNPQESQSTLIQPGEWLVLDTLDLQLSGPVYDVAFYRDGIIFLKPGEGTTYLAPLNQPDVGSSRPLFANKEFSCSPAAFSFPEDQSVGYYSMRIVGEENHFVERIYEMSIGNGEVSNIRPVPFARDSSRYLHPAVSQDGSLMVFSSDRLPTHGGLDLFVTRLSSTGWSDPQNLGASVNTSGHEWYPFLDSRNNLWFSSTGHQGFGGYDLFVCAFNGKDWELPQNLGRSVNTSQDELGLSIHPLQQMALFSRVLPAGSGGVALMIAPGEEASPGDLALLLQQMADAPASPAPRVPPEPEIKTETAAMDESAAVPEFVLNPDPNRVVFRIQVISSLNAKSFPTLLIDGKSYQTYEYYYKGSYRITVGAFYTFNEAKAFRLLCLDSGFKQAFVAAFRGDQRVTDPAVFK